MCSMIPKTRQIKRYFKITRDTERSSCNPFWQKHGFWYLKSRNFREDKFSRISRILSKFAKLNPHEIFPNGWFAKINPREIFKICKFAKINPREIKKKKKKFLFLYIKRNLYKCITKIKSQSIVTVTVMSSIRWVIFVISYSLLLEKVPYIFTSFRFFDFFNSFPLLWPHMFHRLFAMLFFKKGPHYDLVFGLTI